MKLVSTLFLHLIPSLIKTNTTCQTNHTFLFELLGFHANENCETSECDLWFQASTVGGKNIYFYNGDNINDYNSTRGPHRLYSQYTEHQNTINLTVELADEDHTMFNLSASAIIFNESTGVLAGDNTPRCIWRRRYVIPTINTNYTKVEKMVTPIYCHPEEIAKKNTKYTNITINYEFRIGITRKDCTSTSTETTMTSPSTTLSGSVCQKNGDRCDNNRDCCKGSCGGFVDYRGSFQACGIQNINTEKPKILIPTEGSPYILPYPLTNASLLQMIDKCVTQNEHLKCKRNRLKRVTPNQLTQSMVANILVTLSRQHPALPTQCNSTNTCIKGTDCCYENIGFGVCLNSACSPPNTCLKPAELCRSNTDCCSKDCRLHWSVDGVDERRCGIKPLNVECREDKECRSFQCCADADGTKKCMNTICQRTLTAIQNAFNQMKKSSDSNAESEKPDQSFRAAALSMIAIITVLLMTSLVMVILVFIEKYKMDKLIDQIDEKTMYSL